MNSIQKHFTVFSKIKWYKHTKVKAAKVEATKSDAKLEVAKTKK